jgi:hypothetical protein
VLEQYRTLFGDEREDYQQAIDHHYENGPPEDWEDRFVSSYATMHPGEDWAETFAHYLHIRDTLETATAFGLAVAGPRETDDEALVSEPDPEVLGGGFETIIANWLPLTYALNVLNRSMGADPLYPFILTENVIEKLTFVHDRVTQPG